jgi:hypothetical protein
VKAKEYLVAKKKAVKVVPTPDQYLAFIKHVRLQGLGLDSSSASVDRGALSEAIDANDASPLNIDAIFGILAHTENELVAEAKFKLSQVRKSSASSQLLTIECSFSALFQLGSPASEDVVTRFANTEAKLVFWPYLRHFMSDMSHRMAINHILIPLTTTDGTL